MQNSRSDEIISEFQNFIGDKFFPCVAARAALSRGNISSLVAGHMACPMDDHRILTFMYDFIATFRHSGSGFHSAAVIFQGPEQPTEGTFDRLLWQRLQSLSDMDAAQFPYDERVNPDPSSADFSFSLGEEAFFVIGLHPSSARPSRRFHYPALVFNPHAQFEELRRANQYEKMQKIVRSRDKVYSGSVNPMLDDFGKASEAIQYSGRQHSKKWTCPLNVKHGKVESDPAAK